MKYEVYIDSVFVENICFNLLSLQLLCKVFSCTATHRRVFAAAAIGAFLECLLIIVGIGPMWIRFLCFAFLIHICMVSILFCSTKWSFRFRATMILFGLNLLLIGGVSFILTQISYLFPHVPNIVELIGIFYVTGWMIMGALTGIKRRHRKHQYEVIMKNRGERVKTVALLDTGNKLYDPISGKPVVIVEKEIVNIWKPFEQQVGFCVIPYHSLGKRNGMLYGFCIEELEIQGPVSDKKETQVLLGVYEGKISSDGQYHMILHPKLLEN